MVLRDHGMGSGQHLQLGSILNVTLQEVEREISFRTEQGLYYSYFKQLVQAPSLKEGFLQLKQDNLTESTNTVNMFERLIVSSFPVKISL